MAGNTCCRHDKSYLFKKGVAMIKEKKSETAEQKEEAVVEEQAPDQMDAANKTIQNHVLSAMGVGLVPIPLVDLLGITGVQINLIRKLASIYDVPYTNDKIKNVLTPLVGGAVPVLSATTMISLFKAIPIIGQTTGTLAVAITSGAVTYAVGKVFLQHFASGGTFLSFDPEKVRDYYESMVKEGRKKASDLNAGK
ncbi:MAG: DUF697 domain-containing protein [Desulfobacteraceae bacterium]|nr:DUF697 domain-containing protein [Desulfobacteraceae bacterium]